MSAVRSPMNARVLVLKFMLDEVGPGGVLIYQKGSWPVDRQEGPKVQLQAMRPTSGQIEKSVGWQ